MSESAPVTKGPLSSFFKPKGSPSRPQAKAAPAPAPAAGKAKAKPPAPAAPKTLGALPPSDAPTLFDKTHQAYDAEMLRELMAKVYVKDQSAGIPLTSGTRDKTLRLLPAVLFDPHNKRWLLMLTNTTDESPFGGGTVYLASAHGTGQAVTHKALSLADATAFSASVQVWSPGHAGAASPQIGSLLWRLKATFMNFKWETVNVNEITEAFEQKEIHLDFVPLVMPPAPPHITKDLETLPIEDTNDKDAVRKQLSAWCESGGKLWKPPEGKWPWFPALQHDPRKDTLGSRSELAVAINAVMRAPVMASVKVALPDFTLGTGLLQLNTVEVKEKAPPPAAADDDDDDDEAAETRALLAPPKKLTPPPPKPKKKAGKVNGASFVHGAKSALCSDDDSMSEGEEDECDAEQDSNGNDMFIASDDDVDEAGSTASARKARADKASNKRKHNLTKNVVSEEEGDEDDEDDEGEGESSSEASMSEGGSDDASEGDDDDDDDDDILVKPSDNASDADDVMESDEEEEGDRAKPAKASRLVKGTGKKRPKSAPPPKKRPKIVQDDDASDDGAGAVPPSALLAQQRLSGDRSAGSKPLPKMGLSGAGGRVSNGLHARQKLAHAMPPQPKGTDSAMVDSPESLFTPTKPAPKDTPPAPNAPQHKQREPRDAMSEKRRDKLATWLAIGKRLDALIGPVVDGQATNKGSVLSLAPGGLAHFASVMTCADHAFRKLPDDNTIPNSWHPLVENLTKVVSSLVSMIEAADADEKTRKKNDSVNAELGCIAAQSLLKVTPQIEELQQAVAKVHSITNTLVGTSAGMATRIASAAAKKQAVEGK